jgi:hypothetical protein
MKSRLFALFMVALVAAASSAEAQVEGPWRVSGKVASFAFTLNCDFKSDGGRLGGVCVDASTSDPKVAPGKSHTLTAGQIDGDKVSWTYQSSFLLSKFDVTYKGVLSGGKITGTLSARGHEGPFTAVKRGAE